MKERHWNSLVGALRHGHCVLILGSEIPATVGPEASRNDGADAPSFL